MPRLLSHRAALAPLLTLAALALPAGVLVPGGPYRDDRSSPEAVVLSLYDAVNRKDWPRAWSYYEQGARPDYRRFAAGYADTEEVSVKTGMPTWEGVVGSTWWLVPTVIEARGSDGTVTVYAGCYVLQQSNPHLRDTPPTTRSPSSAAGCARSSSPSGWQRAIAAACEAPCGGGGGGGIGISDPLF